MRGFGGSGYSGGNGRGNGRGKQQGNYGGGNRGQNRGGGDTGYNPFGSTQSVNPTASSGNKRSGGGYQGSGGGYQGSGGRYQGNHQRSTSRRDGYNNNNSGGGNLFGKGSQINTGNSGRQVSSFENNNWQGGGGDKHHRGTSSHASQYNPFGNSSQPFPTGGRNDNRNNRVNHKYNNTHSNNSAGSSGRGGQAHNNRSGGQSNQNRTTYDPFGNSMGQQYDTGGGTQSKYNRGGSHPRDYIQSGHSGSMNTGGYLSRYDRSNRGWEGTDNDVEMEDGTSDSPFNGGIFSMGNRYDNSGGSNLFPTADRYLNQAPNNNMSGGSGFYNSGGPFGTSGTGGSTFNPFAKPQTFQQNQMSDNSRANPDGQLEKVVVSTLNKISADDIGIDEGEKDEEKSPAPGDFGLMAERRARSPPLVEHPKSIITSELLAKLDEDNPFSKISELAPTTFYPSFEELDKYNLVPEKCQRR